VGLRGSGQSRGCRDVGERTAVAGDVGLGVLEFVRTRRMVGIIRRHVSGSKSEAVQEGEEAVRGFVSAGPCVPG